MSRSPQLQPSRKTQSVLSLACPGHHAGGYTTGAKHIGGTPLLRGVHCKIFNIRHLNEAVPGSTQGCSTAMSCGSWGARHPRTFVSAYLREHSHVGLHGIRAETALAECQDPKGLTTYLEEPRRGAAP